MAIQIPRIQSTGPVAPEKTGQIDIQPLNVARSNSGLGEGVVSAANNIENQIEFEAQQHANTVAIGAAADYAKWDRDYSSSLKQNQGDPAPLYGQFEKDAAKKRNDILQSYKDQGYDDRTMNAVSQRLQRQDYELANKRATDQATMQSNYQKNVFAASIADKSQSIMESATRLNTKDPKTFDDLRLRMKTLDDETIAQGAREGLVAYNEDGSIKELNPILQSRLTQNRSAALSPTIGALNASGNTDAAKQVLAEYGTQMTPKAYAAALKMGSEVGINQKAAAVYQQIQNLGPEQMNAAISKIEDPRLREKVGSYQLTDVRQKERRDDITSQQNFKQLLPAAQAAPGQGASWDDFQKNPQYIYMKSHGLINEKWDKKLKNIVQNPEKSDPDAKEVMLDSLTDGSIGKMGEDDFQQGMAGLNKQDRNYFTRLRQQAQNPASSSNIAGLNFAMNTGLKDALADAKMIKLSPGGGFASNKERAKFRDYQMQFGQAYENASLGNNHVENRKTAQSWVAQQKSGVVFNNDQPASSGGGMFQGIVNSFKSNSAPPPATPKMNDQQLGRAIMEYNRQHPEQPWNKVPNRNMNMLYQFAKDNKVL